jgi:DNA-3-methyladenine glycosylase II
MLIRPLPPFNFTLTLRFILSPPAVRDGRIFAPLTDYFNDGEYRRVIRIGGQPVLCGVSDEGSGSRPALRVRILVGPDDAATRRALRLEVIRQFAAGLDPAPFYRLARKDPVLRRLVAHFRGLRIAQALSVYETIISAILEQQVNLTFAHQVKKALIEKHGETVEFEGRRYNAFPKPESLAALTPAEFRKLQISGPKARYIIGISHAIACGKFKPEELRSLPSAAARSCLLKHKGIGPWTAEYVGLRALAHLDNLPASDVGLQRAVQRFYRLRKPPTVGRLNRIAGKWAGWRSYATFYLWLTYWETADWKQNLLNEIYSPDGRSRS